ncbi:hypothetical protein [Sideroxydans sp. CL21]|nr:hypothetical protein [Sideroxydans sp. CL21]
MNILVTGDAGVAGGNLAVHLLVQNHEPVILTTKPKSPIKSSVRCVSQ